MEFVPVVAAVGAGGYIGSSIGSRVRAMPKGAFIGPIQAAKSGDFYGRKGFRKRAKAHIAKKKQRVHRTLKLRQNDMNTHFEVLKKLFTIDVAGGTDKFFRFGAQNIKGTPAWNYWANLFDSFKLHWIRVKCHMPGGAFLCSFTDVDELTLPNDMEIILRNPAARIHDTTTDRHLRQRYLPLTGVTAFKDFNKMDTSSVTQLVGNDINPNAPVPTSGYTAGLGKAMICFGCRNDQDLQIHCAVEFGVTYMGLADHNALYA